jgi:hypothetical protein
LGQANFPAFIKEKTLEGVKVGLTSKQSERLVRMYGPISIGCVHLHDAVTAVVEKEKVNQYIS